MIRNRPLYCLLALLATLSTSLVTAAQDKARISELTNVDRQFMQQQRDLLEDLTTRNFGRQFSGTKDNDLDLLQLLLDRRLVRPEQTRELQATGVVLGDLLADELGMHWVIYEDRVGRSRALRLADSDNYLFPVTMIARRREADNDSPVTDIYQKAYDIIAPLKPALPFQ